MPRKPAFKIIGHITDTPAVVRDIPDAPGLWWHDLTGTAIRVIAKRGTGELVFPAGTYAEDETPVTTLEKWRGGPAFRPWSRVHLLIDCLR